MSFVVAVASLALVTAWACALPGVFVVLRKSSMLVDAIGHAVLPGIVLGFLLTNDLGSPLLVIGAAFTGLLVVLGNEFLIRTGLIAGDAGQGLIFPALFAIGVIIVSAQFSGVHLDEHTILAGDLNLAALNTLEIGGMSLGPSYLYLMLGMLALNVVFLTLFAKQLALTTFDPLFARSIGIRAGWVNVAFMFLVSMTVTAAFNALGAILVVALVVIPPATARLLTDRLPVMIALTMVFASIDSVGGFVLAYALDAPTSAGMAIFAGLLFLGALTAVRVRAHHFRHGRNKDMPMVRQPGT